MRSEHKVGTMMQKLAIEPLLLGCGRSAPFLSSVHKGNVESVWRKYLGDGSQLGIIPATVCRAGSFPRAP